MIKKLVRGKMEDGQLDECTLTFRDIGKICAAYETVLKGVFHERIEYPDLNRDKRAPQQKNNQRKNRHPRQAPRKQMQKPQAMQEQKPAEKAAEESK